MFFDPSREQPGVSLLPIPNSEEGTLDPESRERQGTLEWGRGVGLETGDANLREERIENLVDPPPGFLDDLWVGGVDDAS